MTRQEINAINKNIPMYEIIYYVFLRDQSVHEWKICRDGREGILRLDNLEFEGQSRVNDPFFSRYESEIEYLDENGMI